MGCGMLRTGLLVLLLLTITPSLAQTTVITADNADQLVEHRSVQLDITDMEWYGSQIRRVFPNRETGLFVAHSDHAVYVFDFESFETIALTEIENIGTGIQSASLHPDDPIVVFGGMNQTIWEWNYEKDTVDETIIDHDVYQLAFSPSGTLLYVSNNRKGIDIRYYPRTHVSITYSNLGEGSTWAMTVSPDGNYLVRTGLRRNAYLWDFTTDTARITEPDHIGEITWAIFSDGSDLFATGSKEGEIRIWESPSTDPITRFLGHERGFIRGLDFSPDNSLLASASEDRRAFLWDIESSSAVWKFEVDHFGRGSFFNADQTSLFIVSYSGLVTEFVIADSVDDTQTPTVDDTQVPTIDDGTQTPFDLSPLAPTPSDTDADTDDLVSQMSTLDAVSQDDDTDADPEDKFLLPSLQSESTAQQEPETQQSPTPQKEVEAELSGNHIVESCNSAEVKELVDLMDVVGIDQLQREISNLGSGNIVMTDITSMLADFYLADREFQEQFPHIPECDVNIQVGETIEDLLAEGQLLMAFTIILWQSDTNGTATDGGLVEFVEYYAGRLADTSDDLGDMMDDIPD